MAVVHGSSTSSAVTATVCGVITAAAATTITEQHVRVPHTAGITSILFVILFVLLFYLEFSSENNLNCFGLAAAMLHLCAVTNGLGRYGVFWDCGDK